MTEINSLMAGTETEWNEEKRELFYNIYKGSISFPNNGFLVIYTKDQWDWKDEWEDIPNNEFTVAKEKDNNCMWERRESKSLISL